MVRLISGWFASLTLGMLVVGPLAALGVCALVDVGPEGEARASLFPAAVVILDPFVWTSLGRSVAIAGLASLATIAGGTVVGRLAGGAGEASRLAAVVAMGLAAASPPYLIALGASAWLDVGGASAAAGWSRRFSVDPGWVAWAASAAAPGAAVGALAYLRALEALGPSWREAATLAGGSRFGRWRRLAWPRLRPAMARAGAVVFAVTLADPGPPLLLGLRRTLGYQMILTATGDAPIARLAALALIAVATAAVWRVGLRLWAGRDRVAVDRDGDDFRRPSSSWLRAWATTAAAVGFGGFVLAAMIGLGVASRETGVDGATMRRLATDPAMTGILLRSLVMGLGVAALTAGSDRLVARLEIAAGTAAAGRFRRLAKLAAPPPIVAGAAVLAVCRFPSSVVAADWPDLDAAPLVAATLAVWLAVAWSRIDRRPLDSPEAAAAFGPRRDAALLAGAHRGAARRLARGGSFGEGWRDFAATLATAAVALAPAILIASSAATATVGPGVLLYRELPGPGSAVAATLGLVAWAVALATAPIGPAGADAGSSRTSAGTDRIG